MRGRMDGKMVNLRDEGKDGRKMVNLRDEGKDGWEDGEPEG